MTVAPILSTTAGDLPLDTVELALGERTWSILHAGAVISRDEELAYLLGEGKTTKPYGAVLWPSSIALAHELALRDVAGARILELGAGTGVPGIVAASRGAHVVQTDRQSLVLHVCKLNSERNRVTTTAGSIEQRRADWTDANDWTAGDRYDLIIGADILYAEPLHPHLRAIFDAQLAPGGSVIIADPFREISMKMFEALERDGWTLRLDKWSVGVAPPPRPVGVFTMQRASR